MGLSLLLLLLSVSLGAYSPLYSDGSHKHRSRFGSAHHQHQHRPCDVNPYGGPCGVNTSAFCTDNQMYGPCPEWVRLSGSDTCWCPGKGPVKKFTLVVTRDNVTNAMVPDLMRSVIRVNGTIPGPALVVDEGDWLEITVINNISISWTGLGEATIIHWHGMLQTGTQYSDGVPSQTQCVIPNGMQLMYRFRAQLSGTYWYHGHYIEQFVDGLIGPLIVRPSPSAVSLWEQRFPGAFLYDSDWTLMLQDLYNNEAHELVLKYYLTPLSDGNEPIPDAIGVNNALNGTLFKYFPRQERTRIRFIESAAFSMFNISIDGVRMTVIEVDGVAVEPSPVAWFVLNVAQRVSVIVDWSNVDPSVQAVWVRVTAMTEMYPDWTPDFIPPYEKPDPMHPFEYPRNLIVPGVTPLNPFWLGVVQFQPVSSAGPLFPNYQGVLQGPFAPPPSDSNMMSLVPIVAASAPPPTHQMYMEIEFASEEPENINFAMFNGISSMPSGVPALNNYLLPGKLPAYYNYNMSAFNPYEPSSLIPIMYDSLGQYSVPYGAVVELFINNTDTGEHPIHMHAHQFWCLETSGYNPGPRPGNNYLRRDVISVAAGGWARIRFVADNPGTWAFHCHIDWHMAAGLMATIIEAPDVLRLGQQRLPPDFEFLCAGQYSLEQNMTIAYPYMSHMHARNARPKQLKKRLVRSKKSMQMKK